MHPEEQGSDLDALSLAIICSHCLEDMEEDPLEEEAEEVEEEAEEVAEEAEEEDHLDHSNQAP